MFLKSSSPLFLLNYTNTCQIGFNIPLEKCESVVYLRDQYISPSMNDKAILSSVDERDSKIKPNFKELCKKFENLSGTEIGEVTTEIIKTPPIPARRTRGATDNSIRRRDPVLKDSPVAKYRTSAEIKPKRPVSVKERSKLFEETSEGISNKRNTVVDCAPVKNYSSVCQSSDGQDNFIPSALPPAKPPRVFANLENERLRNIKQTTFETEKRSSVNVASVVKLKNGDSKPRNASFSFDTETVKEAQKGLRLMSAPEVLGNGDASKVKNPSGKTHGFRSYIKSTANNLRGKVKQSKIFVDLTPTTVSPPKHYATLKRSKSEEHIYAEPCIDGMRNSKPEETKAVEPLHYMVGNLPPPSPPPVYLDSYSFNGNNNFVIFLNKVY